MPPTAAGAEKITAESTDEIRYSIYHRVCSTTLPSRSESPSGCSASRALLDAIDSA
jgi:hypothetical protein